MRVYNRVVLWSVRHKYVTLVVGLALFAASILSTSLLPAGFLPKEDAARTLMVVELPPGARLEDTIAVTDRIAQRIRTLPEVRSVFVDGGRQLPGKKEVRLATFTINLTPKNARAQAGRRGSGDHGPDARRAGRALLVLARGRPARLHPHRRRRRHRPGDRGGGADAARGRGPAQPRQRDVDRAPRPDRGPHPPQTRRRRRSRRLDRHHRRDGARRDDRRHRPEPRQVQRHRPADPDPGAAADGPARRPLGAREPEGAGEERHLRAARGGGRSQPRPRARPRSTATTGRCAWRWRPTCRARTRSASRSSSR